MAGQASLVAGAKAEGVEDVDVRVEVMRVVLLAGMVLEAVLVDAVVESDATGVILLTDTELELLDTDDGDVVACALLLDDTPVVSAILEAPVDVELESEEAVAVMSFAPETPPLAIAAPREDFK